MSRRSVPKIAPNDLRDHADAERVARVWDRIEHDLTGVREASPRSGGILVGLIAATMAAFGGGLLIGKVMWGDRSDAPVTAAAASDHSAFVDVIAAGSHERTVALPGGGQITLTPETTVEVERSSTGTLTLRLVRGEAAIDTAQAVMAQDLAIVAGEARLSTGIGSVVRVKRNQDDLDVAVSDGSVRITSPAGSAELVRGQSVDAIPIRTSMAAIATDTLPQRMPAPLRHSSNDSSAAVPDAVAPAPDWLTRAKAGDSSEALQLLRQQPGGIAGAIASAKSASELMAISDLARSKGGDLRAALTALTRVVESFSTDPNAQVAVYTLGQMYEKAGQPKLAQAYFEKYRSLSPEGVLAEDALCKQIQAEHRASHKDEAVRMGKEYLSKYPNGRCKEDVERIISGDDVPAEEAAPAPSASVAESTTDAGPPLAP